MEMGCSGDPLAILVVRPHPLANQTKKTYYDGSDWGVTQKIAYVWFGNYRKWSRRDGSGREINRCSFEKSQFQALFLCIVKGISAQINS